jgi:hypothetical protein
MGLDPESFAATLEKKVRELLTESASPAPASR